IPHITVVSKGDSIQSAVDAANPGDIIIVDDGIYKENININKNNLILKSKNGSEKTIVEAADSHDHIFEITANNIEISGFTIRNAIGIWNAGIYTSNGNIKINNNIFQNNYISIWSVGTGMQQEKLFIEDNKFSETPSSSSYGGIYLQRGGANNATITINTIKNNTFNSVYNIVVGRSTSIITNNIFTSSSLELGGTSIQLENCNFENGGVLINQGAYNNIDLAVKNTYINDNPLLYLKGASNYNIENNYGQIILVGCNNITVQNFNISNTIAAVQLINSTNNTILNNTFNKNNYGIYAIQSSYNNITNNNISGSTESGIYLQNGSFNKVLGNNISNNNGYADGIYLNGSNNIISNNTIKDNNYGIKLWTASNNTVKENQILNNGIGIDLYYAKNNVIYNNIFSNNTKNINMWGENSGNIWQAPE
ncbi:MAG TPA: NosD domain-containing protein, partial [Candidatus Pacearchaeota archaeon]|nr:NosD domain-containing protein [Candidatus Pacearchaeota archaeon]